MGKEEELFKDRKIVKNRSKLKEAMKEIVKLLKRIEVCEDKENIFRIELLNDQNSSQEHIPNHNGCDGCETSTKTEKRMCRCMYYFNSSFEKNSCRGCKLERKWKNVGNINITEYEYPTKYVLEKVGGIDLIFDDKYAVEVKPKGSKETLTRMFAEILTYTIDYDYKPAICFFEGSKQMRDFMILYNNPETKDDLLYICKYIKVFYFNIVREVDGIYEFEIREIEDKF